MNKGHQGKWLELTRSRAVELVTAVLAVDYAVAHCRLGQTHLVGAHVVTLRP